jgi:gliding motility-associated-like protein
MTSKLRIFPCIILVLFIAPIAQAGTYNSNTYFIENKGQIKDQNHASRKDIHYILNTPGFKLLIRNTGFSYELFRQSNTNSESPLINSHRIDVEFEHANLADYSIQAMDKRPDNIRYYNQDEQIEVSQYEKVVYRNLYPNIDLIFSILNDNQGKEAPQIKYDFILHPGADPGMIRFIYKGADNIVVNSDNELVITTSLASIRERIPVSYMIKGSAREIIQVDYVFSNGVLSYKIPSKPIKNQVVIDPTVQILWGTYFGGNGAESPSVGITVDNNNNIIFSGYTTSNNIATSGSFQTTYAGAKDGFISKFNSSGTRLWTSYFGDSGEDRIYNTKTDNQNNIIAAGWTNSSSGITTSGSYQPTFGGGSRDAFIVKFDQNGNRLWATYYGGNSFDEIFGLYIDANNNLYCSGWTSSTNVMASTGAAQSSYGGGSYDAFIAKFNSNGNRIWGTFLGGSGHDQSYSVELNSYGHVIVQGRTSSTTNIATSGAFQSTYGGGTFDNFIASYTNSGTMNWCSYYGGSGEDISRGMTINFHDDIFIVGHTTSSNNIATSGTYQSLKNSNSDGFIIKVNASGNKMWGTYYGGNGTDGLRDAISNCNNLIVAGYTESSSNISNSYGYKTSYGGSRDGCFAKFDSSGNLIWGSYYGGSSFDMIQQMALDHFGDFYIYGLTSSSSNIATSGAFQSSKNWGDENYLAKFCFEPSINKHPDSVTVCIGNTAWFRIKACNGSSFQWQKNNVNISGATDSVLLIPSVAYQDSGIYRCIVSNACGKDTSFYALLNIINSMPLFIGNDTLLCFEDSLIINLDNAYTYIWNDSTTSSRKIIHKDGLYWVRTTGSSCPAIDSIIVDKIPEINVSLGPDTSFCEGEKYQLSVPNTTFDILWSTGDTNSSITIDSSGFYWAKLSKSKCSAMDSVSVVFSSIPVFDLGPDTSICQNDTLKIVTKLSGGSFLWSDSTTSSSCHILSPGSVWLTYTHNGCSYTDSIDISMLKHNVHLGEDTTLCAGESLPLSAYCNGARYVWSTSDTTAQILVNKSGQYWVCVYLGHCMFTDTINVLYNTSPNVNLGPDTTLCDGQSYTLKSTFPGAKYTWQDNSTKDHFVVTKPGIYWLIVENDRCSNTDYVKIDYIAAANVQLGRDTMLCQGHVLELRPTTAQDNYLWNNASTDSSITVSSAGWYWCESRNQCSVSRDSIFIDYASKPYIELGNDTSLCDGATLLLNAYYPNASYFWQDYSQDSIRIVDKEGKYIVQVENRCGVFFDSIQVSFFKQNIKMLPGSMKICRGESVNISSCDASRYLWSTGDSSQSITVSPTLSTCYYLSVVDTFGCNITDSINVKVVEIPKAAFAINDSLQCLSNNLFSFHNQTDTSSLHLNWLWEFSHGLTGQNYHTQQSFSNAGNYRVVLHIHHDSVCFDSTGKNLYVVAPPIAQFDTIVDLCTGKVDFINQSMDVFSKTLWDFGDGLTSSKKDASHNYQDAGLYTVILRVESFPGCFDTISKRIEINTISNNYFIPNIFTPNGDGLNEIFQIKGVHYYCNKYRLQIFNRWGQKLYDSDGQEGIPAWDGLYKNKRVSEGVYIYVIQSASFNKAGTITLIR